MPSDLLFHTVLKEVFLSDGAKSQTNWNAGIYGLLPITGDKLDGMDQPAALEILLSLLLSPPFFAWLSWCCCNELTKAKVGYFSLLHL